jgi:tripartite-type tricarboxylate transporter receptor subunit TctC
MKRWVAWIFLVLAAPLAGAQPWPAKPVKFFVAGATGSAP